MKKFLPFLIVGGVVLLFLRGSRAGASPAGNIGGAMLPAGAGAGKDSMSWLAKLLGGVGGIGGGSGGSMSGVSGSIKGVGEAFKSLADLFKKSPSSSSGAGLSAADSWNYDLEAEWAKAGAGPDYSPFAPSGSFGQPSSFDGYTASDFTGGIGDYSPSNRYDFFSGSPSSLSNPSYVPSWGSGGGLYDFGGYSGNNLPPEINAQYQAALYNQPFDPIAYWEQSNGFGGGYQSGGYGNGYGGNYGFSPTPTYSGLFESPTGMGFGGYGGGGDVGGMSFADANAIGG